MDFKLVAKPKPTSAGSKGPKITEEVQNDVKEIWEIAQANGADYDIQTAEFPSKTAGQTWLSAVQAHAKEQGIYIRRVKGAVAQDENSNELPLAIVIRAESLEERERRIAEAKAKAEDVKRRKEAGEPVTRGRKPAAA